MTSNSGARVAADLRLFRHAPSDSALPQSSAARSAVGVAKQMSGRGQEGRGLLRAFFSS